MKELDKLKLDFLHYFDIHVDEQPAMDILENLILASKEEERERIKKQIKKLYGNDWILKLENFDAVIKDD